MVHICWTGGRVVNKAAERGRGDVITNIWTLPSFVFFPKKKSKVWHLHLQAWWNIHKYTDPPFIYFNIIFRLNEVHILTFYYKSKSDGRVSRTQIYGPSLYFLFRLKSTVWHFLIRTFLWLSISLMEELTTRIGLWSAALITTTHPSASRQGSKEAGSHHSTFFDGTLSLTLSPPLSLFTERQWQCPNKALFFLAPSHFPIYMPTCWRVFFDTFHLFIVL